MILSKYTEEVVECRPVEEGLWPRWVIILRCRTSPTWLGKLFGVKPSSEWKVYKGRLAWHDTVTGGRCEPFLESYLTGIRMNYHLLRQKYEKLERDLNEKLHASGEVL